MNFPFDQDIILENERVILRPINISSDAETLWPINEANPMLTQYFPNMISDRDSFELFFESALQLK